LPLYLIFLQEAPMDGSDLQQIHESLLDVRAIGQMEPMLYFAGAQIRK
jgi:hypothetical protein